MVPCNDLLRKLNFYQRRAVLDESRAALVNANVGSGKTTVLIAKALYQHIKRQIPLKEMVVLTFTNKAANEIKSRMRAAEPDARDGDMPWFGTFHSVAMKLLQTLLPVEELGYTHDFSILDPDGQVEMAERLIEEYGLRVKYRRKLAKRLEAARFGQTLYGAMKREDDIGKLCELLSAEKLRQNKMDFDDLIRNATCLLKKGNWSPRWIIIDEFQDCDNSQMEMILALAAKATKLFAVGDPNQSIYGWRGGGRAVFTKFQREFRAKEYSLPLNYRSSATILDAAKCFLEDRSELTGVREPGSEIVVRNHYNPFQEAEYLADKIIRLHGTGVAWRNVAVFYRMQRQSKTLEEAFRREGIPFTVSIRKTLKDLPVLQWLFHLLSACAHQADRNSLYSVLTNAQFGEGLSRAQVKSTLDTGCGSFLYSKIKGFPSWAEGRRTAAEIYNYFGLDEYLSPTSVSFRENKEYILDFLGKLEQYIWKNTPNFLQGLREFLNTAALDGTDFFKEQEPSSFDSVKLMTLHSCKGLEFQYVFIIGVNYGLIPLRADTGRGYNRRDREEEERRLFFVGITRARDHLELSYYTDPGAPRVLPGESSYLSIIPRRLLDRRDSAASDRADLQEYRRLILENRRKGQRPDSTGLRLSKLPKADSRGMPKSVQRKVRHPKYGEGVVESEDEETITAAFEAYGLKTFSKDFCPLEFLQKR